MRQASSQKMNVGVPLRRLSTAVQNKLGRRSASPFAQRHQSTHFVDAEKLASTIFVWCSVEDAAPWAGGRVGVQNPARFPILHQAAQQSHRPQVLALREFKRAYEFPDLASVWLHLPAREQPDQPRQQPLRSARLVQMLQGRKRRGAVSRELAIISSKGVSKHERRIVDV